MKEISKIIYIMAMENFSLNLMIPMKAIFTKEKKMGTGFSIQLKMIIDIQDIGVMI